VKRRWRKRGPVFWLAVAILATVLVIVIWGVAVPVGGGQPQLVTIERGDSVSDVAIILQQKGLIRSADMFALAAYATGKWRRLQAGRHELDGSMSAAEILDALCRGSRRAWRWLIIPEGFGARQVADQIQHEGLGQATAFMQAASSPESFTVAFPLPTDSLEGCLFPDTYRVDSGETESDIIAQMLRRFDQVVWKQLFHEEPRYKGRSLRYIIILASLVEWEAKREDERPIIAGVLVNRLNRGQKLECDATVQYALGEARKPRLTSGDLSVESDYNTYLHEGLPPGPICNPGEASIKAAMNPANVPYLYYVARPDGSHIFTTTYSKHQEAIIKVRNRK
jgi:UPF0755 protein